MNLLLDRDQKRAAILSIVPLRIGPGVTFHLRAELELNPEEEELLGRFRFKSSALVLSDFGDDIRRAFRSALILSSFVAPAIVVVSTMLSGFSLAYVFLAAFVFVPMLLAMTIVYYYETRELIVVRDLLNGGRLFRCDSVVELIQKEAYLENICGYLRQVLESAKGWHDREAVPIEPLSKQAAKQFVLKTVGPSA